jgi:hypothetical protein
MEYGPALTGLLTHSLLCLVRPFELALVGLGPGAAGRCFSLPSQCNFAGLEGAMLLTVLEGVTKRWDLSDPYFNHADVNVGGLGYARGWVLTHNGRLKKGSNTIQTHSKAIVVSSL